MQKAHSGACRWKNKLMKQIKYSERKAHPSWKTKTELKAMGLEPGGEPVAFGIQQFNHTKYYLYEQEAAIQYQRRPQNDAKKAAAKIYRQDLKKRKTCDQCHKVVKALYEINKVTTYINQEKVVKKMCNDCESQYYKEKAERKKSLISKRYRELIEGPLAIIDTETTGLDSQDEVVEIGVIDKTGKILFEAVVKPKIYMSLGASRVNGFTDDMLKDCPDISEVADEFFKAIEGKELIMYNAEFDFNKINYSLCRHDVKKRVSSDVIHCAMLAYMDFIDSPDFVSLKSASSGLEGCEIQSHRAVDDCRMTLKVIKKIAEYEQIVK